MTVSSLVGLTVPFHGAFNTVTLGAWPSMDMASYRCTSTAVPTTSLTTSAYSPSRSATTNDGGPRNTSVSPDATVYAISYTPLPTSTNDDATSTPFTKQHSGVAGTKPLSFHAANTVTTIVSPIFDVTALDDSVTAATHGTSRSVHTNAAASAAVSPPNRAAVANECTWPFVYATVTLYTCVGADDTLNATPYGA